MTHTAAFTLATVLAGAAIGCGGSGTKADSKKAEAQAGATKTDDAKSDGAKKDDSAGSEISLPKTGLKGTAPGKAEVSDMMGSDMVSAPGLVVTVHPGEGKPKTIEEAKKEADMFSPKDLKEEKLADGFVLTFNNEGGMGKNFHVNVRREIDGKGYWCQTMASQQEQADNAVKFCKSLKK